MQVLSLIARGCTDRDIAAMLSIAFSTARKHRENLQRKLGLHKSVQLAVYYLERRPALAKATPSTLGLAPLSGRELEVLYLFAQGMSDKHVARQLAISDLTVRKHRANMQGKLAVSNICALLFEAYVAGWLVLPLPTDKQPTYALGALRLNNGVPTLIG
jgi:DNA-binding NarL/FixJ family response regulator